MNAVTVRFFAAAAHAAGRDHEVVEMAAESTLADLVEELVGRHGDRLEQVLQRSSLLVDEVVGRDRDALMPAGATVDVLPPFAGG